MNQNRGSLKRRGRRNDLGQAMIEFSLVMSLLLVPIVVGMAGFATYIGNFLALTDAVSFGAKQLAASRGANNLDPCALLSSTTTTPPGAVIQAYRAAAVESATPSLTITLTIYSTTGGITGNGTPTTSTNCKSAAPFVVQGGTVKVSATHTTQSIFGSYGSFTISAQSQERVQ